MLIELRCASAGQHLSPTAAHWIIINRIFRIVSMRVIISMQTRLSNTAAQDPGPVAHRPAVDNSHHIDFIPADRFISFQLWWTTWSSFPYQNTIASYWIRFIPSRWCDPCIHFDDLDSSCWLDWLNGTNDWSQWIGASRIDGTTLRWCNTLR